MTPAKHVTEEDCNRRHRGTKWVIGSLVAVVGVLLTGALAALGYSLSEARYAANTADGLERRVVAIEASETQFRNSVLTQLTQLVESDRALTDRVDKVLMRLPGNDRK